MLRHRYIVALFVLFLALPFAVDYFSELPWFYYLLVTLLFLTAEFYGAYFIHSNFHINALCSATTHEKIVALTFDDGPNKETPNILNVLKEHEANATFFCIGNRIAGNENTLKRMSEEGHFIGNHSFSHGFFFDLKRTSAFIKELKDTSETIKSSIGKTPHFFRPPYGVTTPALARAIKKLNFSVIGWNIRSLDTSIKDKAEVLQRIKKGLKPGSIILLHDTIPGNAELLREILMYLKSQNYSVVSLESLLHEKAYA